MSSPRFRLIRARKVTKLQSPSLKARPDIEAMPMGPVTSTSWRCVTQSQTPLSMSFDILHVYPAAFCKACPGE